VVLPIAAAAGNLAHDLAGDKRRLVRENLARPLGLDPGHRRVRRAARRAFRNYAKYLVDVMRLAGTAPEEVGALVDIANVELLDEAQAPGKGVLLCTVHVGGMDLISPALANRGEQLHVVADDTTYGRLYDHLKAVRARHGLTLIGWRKLRSLFRALQAGGNLVLFCDGGYRAGDVPVEFLGEPTTFPAGPATLSARSGAPMLPVACQRTRGDRFRAEGKPLIFAASGTCSAQSGHRPIRNAPRLAPPWRRRGAARAGTGRPPDRCAPCSSGSGCPPSTGLSAPCPAGPPTGWRGPLARPGTGWPASGDGWWRRAWLASAPPPGGRRRDARCGAWCVRPS
jgi:KDO2-lipid IV(A) lauroyltransferase